MKRRITMLIMTAALSAAVMAQGSVSYQRPEGAFYQGMSESWGNYPVTKIVVRPWTTFTYINKCSDPLNSTWTMDGETLSPDLDGNMQATVEPIPEGYVETMLPTLTAEGQSYTLGQGHKNWETYKASVAWADSIVPMSVADPGRVIGTSGSGSAITNFRPMSMVSGYKYNFGTMPVSISGDTYYNRGVRQFFESPMGALWVDRIVAPAISYSSTPLPSGKQLTLNIYESVVSGSSKSVGTKIATLVCSADDVKKLGTQTVSGNTIQMLTLVFRRTGNEDIILSKPFVIEIEGFQEDGVDVGLAAQRIDDNDKDLCSGSLLLMQDSGHNNIGGTLSYSNTVPCLSIMAMYDNVVNVTDEASDQLEVAETGGQALRKDGKPAQVKTAIAWKYEEADANYTVEGLPSWLTLSVDESRRDFNGSSYGHGLVTLNIAADPLPAGTDTRSASIYIKGRGVKSEKPIMVTQSNTATGISTIDNTATRTDEPIYNLAGQRVGSNSKGTVIRNGRKYLKK